MRIMAKFHYLKDAAGIPAGTIKYLPDNLAAKLVELGVGNIEGTATQKKGKAKMAETVNKITGTAPKREKKQ